MEKKRMGVYFYPTTAVLIDDSRTFLNTLSLKLDNDIVYRLFADPKLALNYIIGKHAASAGKPSCFTLDDEQYDPDEQNFKLAIKNISTPLADPNRFNEVSVIVLDFSMPTMDGLTFIEQLQQSLNDHPIKIIMVTGEADKNLAVKLFNEGKIHKFLLKREPRLEKLVNDSIREMQQAYFLEQSAPILTNVTTTTAPCLADPIFIDKFFKICHDLKATEYYLYDNIGSFILVNECGETRLLLVRMADDLTMYTDMAEDQNLDASVINQLKQGAVLPFFSTLKQFISTSGEQWPQHLYPAQALKGQQDYYYSLLDKPKSDYLPHLSDVLSFREYIRQAWPPVS